MKEALKEEVWSLADCPEESEEVLLGQSRVLGAPSMAGAESTRAQPPFLRARAKVGTCTCEALPHPLFQASFLQEELYQLIELILPSCGDILFIR